MFKHRNDSEMKMQFVLLKKTNHYCLL